MKINYLALALIMLFAISCQNENKPIRAEKEVKETQPSTEEKGITLIFGIKDKMDTLSYRDIVKHNYDNKIFKSIDEERFENLRLLLLDDISIDFVVDSLEIECFLKPLFIKGRNLTEVEIYADSNSKMNIRSESGVRKSDFRESVSILKKAYLDKYEVLSKNKSGLAEYIELTDEKRRIKLSISEYSFAVSYRSETYFTELASLKKIQEEKIEKALIQEKDSLKNEFLKMKDKSDFFKNEI